MTSSVFGQNYANAYDILYQDKDYEAECDFLEEIFRNLNLPVKTILDLGCGTGAHAISLARRGYQVDGIDRSVEMLKTAKEKADSSGVKIDFVPGDIRTLDLGCTFDAVISMFAVMSYQSTNADVAAVCQTARRHLNQDGIFIFDAWHGPGVLTDPPTQRVKIVQDGIRRVVRFTEPVVDVMAHTVETRFKVWTTEDNRIISEVDESHLMRFFFPQEIAYFLGVAGFNNVRFCPFMELDKALDQSVWNVAVMAQC